MDMTYNQDHDVYEYCLPSGENLLVAAATFDAAVKEANPFRETNPAQYREMLSAEHWLSLVRTDSTIEIIP